MSRSLAACLIILSLFRPDAGARALGDIDALFQTDVQVKGPSLSPNAVPANRTALVAPVTPGIHAEVSAPGARAGSAKAFAWWRDVGDDTLYNIVYALIAMCFLVAGTLLALPVVIVRMVHRACKRMNKSSIGLAIEIGGVSVNLPKGVIRIDMLVLHNPLSHFGTPYLLKVGKVNIDILITTLLSSFFRDVRIRSTRFADVDINYEKVWGTSNIQLVANMIGSKKPQALKPPPSSSMKLELHRVTVENVTARIQNQNFLGRGSRLPVGDVSYTDFLLETGKSQTDEVAKALLLTVLKTAMQTMNENDLGDPLVM